MPLSSDETGTLVAALLTVNLYPLARAHALLPGFRAAGLLDPAAVAAMPQPAVIAAMEAAGYTRGGFLPIVSFRLYALLEAVAAGELDGLRAFVAAGDRAGFVAALGAIKGFGPSTAGAAWELWAADRG